ncbi:glycosyltransferase family 8 protein [Reyranella sp.]|uniref:glycosyltransferase family 8 protein n=1 Tax=Reyranella sp. TaxID=1929291 RepID=UPI003D1256F8
MTLLGDATVASSSEPGQPIRVMFCCDPRFYQHLAVAIASLLKNNQRHSLDITVVSSGQDAAAERKLVSILPYHPDAKVTIKHFGLEGFNALPTSGHITVETYLRILALDTLPPDCEKIIYLDCDLVVVSTLDGLWEVDLGDYALAAVPDPYGAERPRVLGMPDSATYVNAGVLLINVKRWRDHDLAASIIAYAEHEGDRLRYHDQDAINALLHAETRILPFRWNCQARMFETNRSFSARERKAIAVATRDPAIIHYTTPQKPWISTAYTPQRAIYRRYLAMTAWNGAPMRQSIDDLPEALYNRIANACGSSLPYKRFLESTNAGRVIFRSWQAVGWIASLLRTDAVSKVFRRTTTGAPKAGRRYRPDAGLSRPAWPDAVDPVQRDMP